MKKKTLITLLFPMLWLYAAGQEATTLSPVLQELKANMVRVDGGTFTMGAAPNQLQNAESDEKATHAVTLDTFYICKYEVTQDLWTCVMDDNPSYFKGGQLPVESVTWGDCQKFIKKLNALTGENYRLPTEAEWEYAARGGKKSGQYMYAGSNDLDQVAWYDENSGFRTHPVATKKANELGLFDMSGNLWEWCQDRYGKYTYEAQVNPVGPQTGPHRVARGGAHNSPIGCCRVSIRCGEPPREKDDELGLRLAL